MMLEGDFTWGGEHTIQCIDDVFQNCTPETYIILFTNITPINSINKNKLNLKRNYIIIRLSNYHQKCKRQKSAFLEPTF